MIVLIELLLIQVSKSEKTTFFGYPNFVGNLKNPSIKFQVWASQVGAWETPQHQGGQLSCRRYVAALGALLPFVVVGSGFAAAGPELWEILAGK